MFSSITSRSVGQSSFHSSVFTRYSRCIRETSAAVGRCSSYRSLKQTKKSADTFPVRDSPTTTFNCFVILARKYSASYSLTCQRANKMNRPREDFSEVPMSSKFRRASSGASDNDKTLDEPCTAALKIFMEAVDSVKPAVLLKNKVTLSPDLILEIDACDNKTSVNLKEYENVFIVGFGKAALPMAEEVMNLLGNERVKKCYVNIPEGFRDSANPLIEINRGAAKNIPDEAAFHGAQRIVEIVKSSGPNDLLIVLITGGGSALLPYPIPPLTMEEKSQIVRKLSIKGATIQELNSVRKRLSLVKGGGLARLSGCNRIVSLILSDVLGDPLDVIASGPTVPNPDPQNLALQILEKHLPARHIPENAKTILKKTTLNSSLENKTVSNLIIGNNSVALEKAAETAKSMGFIPLILTNTLSGEASEVGERIAGLAIGISAGISISKNEMNHWSVKIVESAANKLGLEEEMISKIVSLINDQDSIASAKGVCFLFGGETTVNVKGKGIGGRNQELVLRAAIQLDGSINTGTVLGKVAILSGGTDGFDGPCDAAGALCDASTILQGVESKQGLNAFDHLLENDSYNYFSKHSAGKYHIKTGHTETNVMDIIVLVVLK